MRLYIHGIHHELEAICEDLHWALVQKWQNMAVCKYKMAKIAKIQDPRKSPPPPHTHTKMKVHTVLQ